ncbi:four-helix bundle copper-binding protein [Roseomonas sp. GC11]|uniref:four-helix bundle copper-binding protein n=1 Tax=Roseomonas sp. GC11 TaxID=2950546 RepID=UPI00210A23AA|nr:four-helix bundle copper-binding protein [Roseomonas sp. GC11]MCQ4162929.1 four-helix bundle copper-binding protein [Roseomonas sp. GC11]
MTHLSPSLLSPSLRHCIDHCLACHAECLSTLSGHCLEAGGRHAAPDHVRLMLACAEICRSTAHLLLLGSPRHAAFCTECAAICTECAAQCEALGGMEECVAACRACAALCAAMAKA